MDSCHLRIAADTAVVARTRPNTTAATVEPEAKIIEDLFREAREGRFDAFSRWLKGVIQQYAVHICTSRDIDTSARASGPSLDSLADATQRGAAYALSDAQKPGNLTLQAAARYAGISDNTNSTQRQNREINALVAPNRSRGFRYPKWQFDVEPERLRLAIQALTDMDRDNCWVLNNFFTSQNSDLEDMRLCEYLADPSRDIKHLIGVLKRWFPIGYQGAA